MGRPNITVAARVAGMSLPWIPVLVITMVFLATASAVADTGRVILTVTHNGGLVEGAGVSIHTPSGDSLHLQARTNKAGIATFIVSAGSYKFCVDNSGCRTWSHVVHTLPNEITEVKLALEKLAADKTLVPNPIRLDGTPPEKEPIMLASLAGLSGILTQSTVAAVGTDRLYWYVNNHLGTPMMVVDENQEVVWQGSATPFGKTAITVNKIGNSFRFPGQYFDVESGLHYNYHRYYDPSVGRYITSDPIGLIGGINLFAYATQNPMSLFDPFGLEVSWRVFSRSMSVTGGVPPGIDAPRIPWRAYGQAIKPSERFLSSTAFAGHTLAWSSGRLKVWPAAIGFATIGQLASSLKTKWYSANPAEEVIVDSINNLTPSLPPGADEIKREIIKTTIKHIPRKTFRKDCR